MEMAGSSRPPAGVWLKNLILRSRESLCMENVMSFDIHKTRAASKAMPPSFRAASWSTFGTLLIVFAILNLALAVPSQVMAQGDDPGPCNTNRDKTAEPALIDLGDAVTVTLSFDGSCPETARKADVVLVLDASTSMYDRDKLIKAKAAAKLFVDEMDPQLVQIGLVSFNASPKDELDLTVDYARVKRAIDAVVNKTGTNIVDGLDAGAQMSIGSNHRPDATPVVVFLTDGGHSVASPPFDDIDQVIDRVRAAGIETYAIGLDGAERWVLRRIAGARSRYVQVADPDRLAEIYRVIAGRIKATKLFTTITIEDFIPDNMTYVSGSAEPAAYYDAAAHKLAWSFQDVPQSGDRMTYRLVPEEVGVWPTNVQAYGPYTDGLGHEGRIVFPIPTVEVRGPEVPEGCVCRITLQKAPRESIEFALANPERISGWNRLLDESKPGAPPFPNPGHDLPPNPRRTCLDIQNRAIPFHPLFNGVIWRAGCLEGPARP